MNGHATSGKAPLLQTLSNAGMGKEMDLVRGSILLFCWEIVVSDSETVFHSIVSELGHRVEMLFSSM